MTHRQALHKFYYLNQLEQSLLELNNYQYHLRI